MTTEELNFLIKLLLRRPKNSFIINLLVCNPMQQQQQFSQQAIKIELIAVSKNNCLLMF